MLSIPSCFSACSFSATDPKISIATSLMFLFALHKGAHHHVNNIDMIWAIHDERDDVGKDGLVTYVGTHSIYKLAIILMFSDFAHLLDI